MSEGNDVIGGMCNACGAQWCRQVCKYCKKAYRFKSAATGRRHIRRRYEPNTAVVVPRGQLADDCGPGCTGKAKPFSLAPGDLKGIR